MRSTTGDCSQLSADCECVWRKYRPPCTCISNNSQMNARCKTARTRSLSLRPESIGDPTNNNGFEFSTNFLHLFRQSALLKSHFRQIKSPRTTFTSTFVLRELCTHPLDPFQYQLSLSLSLSFHCCCCCFPRLDALLDAPCASLPHPVVQRLRRSLRSLVPNPVLAEAVTLARGGNAPLPLLPPFLVVT